MTKSKTKPRISAIVPIYGNLGDLPRLLDCLRGQTLPPHEIIVVDSSPRALEKVPDGIKYLKNPEDIAFGYDMNFGSQHATGDFLLIVQQDCLPEKESAIEELHEAITALPNRVAASCTVALPQEIWDQYNFWGKVLMVRWIGDIKQGISDKFDLIRKSVFDRIHGYDIEHFRFCGQDQDLYMRLSAKGEVFVAPTRILHIHNQSRKTGPRDLFTKQFQLAQSFGALFRKWNFELSRAPYAGKWTHHLAKFMYPMLALIPFWPLETCLTLFFMSQFINTDVWRIRHLATPLMILLNPLLFLTGALGTAIGLITGKQHYSEHK